MRKVKIQPSLRLLPHKMHSNITRWERLPQLGSQRGALNSFRLQMDYSNLTLLNMRVSAFGNSTWAQCYNGLAQQCRLLSKTRYCTGHACLLVRGWQNKPGLDSYHSAHSWKKLRFYDNVCHILLKKKKRCHYREEMRSRNSFHTCLPSFLHFSTNKTEKNSSEIFIKTC